MSDKITVETTVDAPVGRVWEYWTEPEHISGWAFASDDWEADPRENDLRVGGAFTTTMSAKDQSASFDFAGTYTAVQEHQRIEFEMTDGRQVAVAFEETPKGVHITEAFDPEDENPEEMQRTGWQAFLDNFKSYAESR